MNYIAASEIENKESELTLRNEDPKVGNDSKNDGSMAESSLKNDTPLADHSLRKEVNPPKSSAFAEHKRVDEAGKVKWDRTHFILGIESGYSMKRRWGQVVAGIQNWLRSISSDNVLVSLFTYDSVAHVEALYKHPRDLNSLVDKGIEAKGGAVNLSAALSTFPTVIAADEGRDKSDWLHYGFIFACEDSPYSQDAVNELVQFKETKVDKFFFNVLSQVERTFEMTRVATALDGVHYSVRKGADFGKSLAEALTRDPAKSY